LTREEAAKILGVSVERVEQMQRDKNVPDPIPDGYFDSVIKFRIDLEHAHRRRIDARNGA
jgi:hypothetical protein